MIRYDWRNNSVLFVHNLDEKPREVSFAVGLPGEAGKLLVNLLSEDHSHADDDGRHTLLLEGYGYRWYRVGGLDYLLKRSDIDTNGTPVTRRDAASSLHADAVLIHGGVRPERRGSRLRCRADRARLRPARPAGRATSTAGFRGRSRSSST